MYPEIRLIGTVQAMDEPIQGKPDRVLTIVSSLRDGKSGSFRVRVPSQDARGCSIGDEILVQGELDEVGAVQTLHGGLLRKLAPMANQHAPKPETTPNAVIYPPRAVPSAPHPLASSAPVAPGATPAVSSADKPTPPATPPAARLGTQTTRSPFGGLFGAMKPTPTTAGSPSSSAIARPAASPMSQPGTANKTAAAASKGFASARMSATPTTTMPTPEHARPVTASPPRHSWDAGTEPVAQAVKAPARKPKSELAEYLQDEIPW